MSRNVVAVEIQHLLEQLQQQCQNGERLAAASGLVDPKRFRAMQVCVMQAAGDLDQKGLLLRHTGAAMAAKEMLA